MSNLFETFAEDYPAVTFIKVDVDKCDEILYEMTLKALPTVIGKVLKTEQKTFKLNFLTA